MGKRWLRPRSTQVRKANSQTQELGVIGEKKSEDVTNWQCGFPKGRETFKACPSCPLLF